MHRIRATTLLLLPLLGSLAAVGCQDNETAIARGDRLWADSAFTSAAAEYRLAVAQRGDEEALARLAHAYAEIGQMTEARDAYDRLLEMAPDHADQAAYDFLQLIDRSLRRSDALGVTIALDAALSLRPELQLPNAVRPVARLHRERGDLAQAVDYYRRALTSVPADSTPPLLYEIGLLYEELERCDTGIHYFRAAREQAEHTEPRRWRTLIDEARWQTGACAFRMGQEAQAGGRAVDALAHFEEVIRLGEPENLLDQTFFERGEILLATGRFEEALESYRTVVRRNPSRTGQLVERAQRRIDEIRFGDFVTDTASAGAASPRAGTSPWGAPTDGG